jgi:2-dehydropantoate 2-reductase
MHEITPAWYILGTGAIGTLFSAKLLSQSVPCVLLERQNPSCIAVSDTRLQTLSITHLDNSSERFEVEVSSIKDDAKIEHLLLCTKSYQSLAALQSIAHRLSDHCVIVLLQNGMGQQQLIQKAYPRQLIIAATTSQGALLTSTLNVSHTGSGLSVFGCFDTNTDMPNNIKQTLTDIGMQWVQDIEQRLWNKVKINAVINPLTALNNCQNGVLLSDTAVHQKMQLLCAEIDALDLALNRAAHTPTLELASEVAAATAQNRSSMLQDVSHKRKTEINFINQHLQNKACELAIDMPINKQLITDIKSLELSYL